MKWLLLTVGPAVVVIAAFAEDIFQLWLGADFARESAPVLQILAVGILLSCMVQVQYAVVQALGRPDLTAKFHVAQLPIHGFLLWWLVGHWGIIGAAIAQSMRLAIEGVILLIASCRMVSLPFHSLISGKVIQSWLLLLVFVVMSIGVSSLSLSVWLRLSALVVIFSAVGLSVWRYSFDHQDRIQLAKLFSLAIVR